MKRLALALAGGVSLAAAPWLAPGSAVAALVVGAFGDLYALCETLTQAAPLAIVALGVTPAVRAGVFTIGSEGQLVAGATAATAAILAAGPGAGGFLLPLGALAGAIGGAAYALPPAWLRTRFGVNEALSTLLLNYVAAFGLVLLLKTALASPAVVATPHSQALPEAALLPKLAAGTRLHAGVLAAPLFGLVLAFWRASPGGAVFELFAQNRPLAARLGLSEARAVFSTMLAAGAAAGYVGWMQVAGLTGTLYPSVGGGLGFTGILAAMLGGLRPLAILAAALALGALTNAAQGLQTETGTPASLAVALQGGLLILVALASQRRLAAA